MTPPTITKVTTGRILSDEDYCEMYAELEGDGTPHTVVKRIGEPPSAAAWYKWRKGDGPLTANMQAKLRAAHGIVTVADACATASETATVYHVGSEMPHTVVMVGTLTPVELRINGTVTASVAEHAEVAGNATPASADKRQRIYRTYVRPCATASQETRRVATGATWAEIIEAGLHAMEMRR